MLPLARVPLAWLNLTHDKRRLLIRVLGVSFAVFLMFVELGFWNALLDAGVQIVKQFDGDLFIVSDARYAMAIKESFPRARLDQTLTVPGVKAAYPVYLEYVRSLWKDTGTPEDKRLSSQPIRVIAFDPDLPVLDNEDVRAHQAKLKTLYDVLIDRRTKSAYGKRQADIERELAEHNVFVSGTFRLGTDFTSDGSVIMSDRTYAELFPYEPSPGATLGLVDVGVVKLEPGADVEALRKAVDDLLPDDVNVYTKEAFIAREQRYWQTATPVGFIFLFGMCMGFIVGSVICYQIISTDVSEHLSEFATLRAIGYTNAYLNRTVLREALWLALLGFLPGIALSEALYWGLDEFIGLPMSFTVWRVLLVLGLTTLMCVLSGLIALRKVRTADPAEVFG
jgi:putative ABC transport system permease protein